eukprot:PRCOL_00003153-RA
MLALAAAKGHVAVVRMLLSGEVPHDVAVRLPSALLSNSEGETDSASGSEDGSGSESDGPGVGIDGESGGDSREIGTVLGGARPTEVTPPSSRRATPLVRSATPGVLSGAPRSAKKSLHFSHEGDAQPPRRPPAARRVPDITAEEERQIVLIQSAARRRLAQRRTLALKSDRAKASAADILPAYVELPATLTNAVPNGLLLTAEEEEQVVRIQALVRGRRARRGMRATEPPKQTTRSPYNTPKASPHATPQKPVRSGAQGKVPGGTPAASPLKPAQGQTRANAGGKLPHKTPQASPLKQQQPDQEHHMVSSPSPQSTTSRAEEAAALRASISAPKPPAATHVGEAASTPEKWALHVAYHRQKRGKLPAAEVKRRRDVRAAEEVAQKRLHRARRRAAAAARRREAAARIAARLLAECAPSGATALHVAAGAGQTECVQELVNAGAHVAAKMNVGATPAFMALVNGRAECASLLLAAERDTGAPAAATTRSRETLLHAAARSGNAECVALAVAHLSSASGSASTGGGNANTDVYALRDAKGNLPLHHAARARTSGALEALLERQAAAKGTGRDSGSIGDAGTRSFARKPVALLQSSTRAALDDDLGTHEVTKTKPIDVAVPGQLTTPLMVAAAANSDVCARVLLERGASLEARDARGRTALAHAAGSGAHTCLLALLAAGANAEVRDESAWTPLMHAASGGHDACVRALLSGADGGVDVNAEDLDGMLAIHLAAREGKARAAVSLAQAGGCLLARDAKYRLSAREWAERGGHWKCAEVLKLAARERWLQMPL